MRMNDKDKVDYERKLRSVKNVSADNFAEYYNYLYPNMSITSINTRETFEWSCQSLLTDQFQISRMQSNTGWSAHFHTGTNRLGLVLPREGSFEARVGRTTYKVDPNFAYLTAIGCNAQLMRKQAALSNDVIVWDTAYVMDLFPEIPSERFLQEFVLPVHIDLSQRFGRALKHLVSAMTLMGIEDEGTPAPHALALLSEAILNLLYEHSPTSATRRSLRGSQDVLPKHLKWAIAYMHAHLAQPLRMQDVAKACGISVRALEFGFKRFKSVSPAQYLRDLRMQAIRQQLQSGSVYSVSVVARSFGFSNPGRFAQAYKLRWGEFPSETIRKA